MHDSTFMKIVQIFGAMVVGKNAATATATNEAVSAYSIRS